MEGNDSLFAFLITQGFLHEQIPRWYVTLHVLELTKVHGSVYLDIPCPSTILVSGVVGLRVVVTSREPLVVFRRRSPSFRVWFQNILERKKPCSKLPVYVSHEMTTTGVARDVQIKSRHRMRRISYAETIEAQFARP